tara:strand:- start:1005 stop:1445 length:441 start_codon:yes stop_codon:yes gene_type:complete
MAIIDKNHNKWFVVDRAEQVSIGLKLPLILDNGEFSSTKTTLEAVKQNVLNLCSTERGERLMQPNLGITLKKFLFEPFTEDIVAEIQNTVKDSMNYWLPFVSLDDISVKMSDNKAGDFRNTMELSVHFHLKKDPSTHESVQIKVGE